MRGFGVRAGEQLLIGLGGAGALMNTEGAESQRARRAGARL